MKIVKKRSFMNRKKYLKYIGNMAVALPLAALPVATNAADFNAEKVLNEMSAKEQAVYLAGVVEGLAIARYMKDGKKTDGMGCIYDWFYKDKNIPTIMAAFERYPTYQPGAIVDVLVKQKCGE